MGLKHIKRDIAGFFGIGKLQHKLRCDNYRTLLETETLYSHEPGTSNELYCGHEVVVSLTTYGKRINTVFLSIASIMRQSRKANRIILWLSEDEFAGKPLPYTLILLEKRGLEIAYCTDTRSYKKLIPSLKRYPDAAIITIDDDVMYEIGLIDRLVRAHIAEPKVVWSNRVRRIATDCKGNILPYKKWGSAKPYTESDRNMATGVGGVLYPPHIFSEDIFDETKFMTLAPTADDLWFKAMELYSGIKVKRVEPSNSEDRDDHLGGIVKYEDGLAGENVIKGRNDIIVKALAEYFDKMVRD